MHDSTHILYCHCTYAKVVPEETKREVLKALSASGVGFDAVADLCDMSARKDPAMKRYSGCGDLRIAACFPRAVKWLFHSGGAPLPEDGVTTLNMRDQSTSDVLAGLLAEPIAKDTKKESLP